MSNTLAPCELTLAGRYQRTGETTDVYLVLDTLGRYSTQPAGAAIQYAPGDGVLVACGPASTMRRLYAHPLRYTWTDDLISGQPVRPNQLAATLFGFAVNTTTVPAEELVPVSAEQSAAWAAARPSAS